MTLKDRMVDYEAKLDVQLNYCLPTVIRLDGKGFSKLKRLWKLQKPFDTLFHNAMIASATYLLENIQNAQLVWTGSDEISVFIDASNQQSPWYSKRIFKWLSISASYASVIFNNYICQHLDLPDMYFNVLQYPGFFDSKVFQFPNVDEALNNFIYRQNDLHRNSITEYANHYFSHKEMLNKNSEEKIQLLLDKANFDYNKDGINWVKYGTLLYKQLVMYDISTKQISKDSIIDFNEEKHYIRTEVKTSSDKLTLNTMKEVMSDENK